MQMNEKYVSAGNQAAREPRRLIVTASASAIVAAANAYEEAECTIAARVSALSIIAQRYQ